MDAEVAGSKAVVKLTDWELLTITEALSEYRQRKTRNKDYAEFIRKLEDKLSEALNQLVKAEIKPML